MNRPDPWEPSEFNAFQLRSRIAVLESALAEATDFVDRHSEPWYKSGQALLTKCRAALASPSTSEGGKT